MEDGVRRIFITAELISGFAGKLSEEEKSDATREKYLRDVGRFARWANGRELDKALLLDYKNALGRNYTAKSANSMLAAINSLMRFAGMDDLCVKQFRIQKEAYCSASSELTREEYLRLVAAAKSAGDHRSSLILQTVCCTGIRISELEFITVEAAQQGETAVCCKGKTRKLFIVSALREKLLRYARKFGVRSGPIFVTRGGRPVDRSNVWRRMKSLCADAHVEPGKVFPHNLRHLFARTFYENERDIAALADILGHSSVNTTRIYIISTGSEHAKKLENMKLVT